MTEKTVAAKARIKAGTAIAVSGRSLRVWARDRWALSASTTTGPHFVRREDTDAMDKVVNDGQ